MSTFWKFVLPVPLVLGLFAMMPQDPVAVQGTAAKEDPVATVRFAELQYVDRSGQTHAVPSRNVLVLRVIEGLPEGMRLEIFYENGDYSLVDVNGFHLLRQGRDVQEVRLVRTTPERVLFPKIP